MISDTNGGRGKEGTERRWSLFWRVAVVFVATVLLWRLVVEGTGPFFGPAHSDRVGHAVRAVAVSMGAVPLIVLARRSLDRRPWAGLRLTPLRSGWKPALFGTAFWVVAAGCGLAVTVGFGWVHIDFRAPSAETVHLALYLPLLVFLYEALPEELIFRGYFYRNLAARYTRWSAVVLQAVLFTLFGVAVGAAGSVDRIVLFFTFSIVLGVLRVVTDSLWASIGFHLVFQWVAQFSAAATRADVLRIAGQPTFEFVMFFVFPIVIGCVVLVGASLIRGRIDWRKPDPDRPGTASTR